MTPTKTKAQQDPTDYSATSIQVLKGLEAVRKRPGMYIGSTGPVGLHHLVWEVVDNSVDEAMAGHGQQIDVVLHRDGSCSVQDFGRGIPTGIHPTEKKSGVELALTVLHAGGKFDKGEGKAYNTSGGLHGVGVSVVNALSTWVVVTVDQNGKRYEMRFKDGGAPAGPLTVIGKATKTGTRVQFMPDATIFTETTIFDHDTVAARLRQTAFLNAGLTLTLTDERGEGEPRREVFCYKDGLKEMVAQANATKGPLHADVIHLVGNADTPTEGRIGIEIAFQYNAGFTDSCFSFANTVRTPDGGTHETGFFAALTNAVKGALEEYGTQQQKKVGLQGSDLREGLTAVISVRITNPQFEGQTKGRLNNSEVRGAVQSFVGEKLTEYFAERPKTIRAILDKAHTAAKGREAARAARERVRSEKSGLDTGVLPGKLADCSSNDPTRCELYLVEGDSAGGSAKQGRSREFQAILPLRGKVLNCERAAVEKMLDNAEIRAIITALGTGFLQDFDITKLRYHKIVIMTDADVDGAHIRTLLLTLFYRHFTPLVEDGHIYIAQPPLFQVRKGKQEVYCYTEAERDAAIAQFGRDGNTIVQRYKGLGEMNADQLFDTTMDPDKRTLLQVTVEDAIEADQAFSTLMGDEVEPRRVFIETNAQFVRNLDI